MKVVLTLEQANILLNYLATRPYAEVVKLIELLQSCVQKEPNADSQG